MTSNTDKKALRRELITLRDSIVGKNEKNRRIADRLLELNEVANADSVLIYASFGSEADTSVIAERLRSRGIRTAYPKCHGHGIMTFHTVVSPTQLISGFHGISEPDDALPQPRITDKTVCIVPGVAFTINGERLGYGGGFYDRFLAEHDIPKIALCFEQLIVSELPTAAHDINVNTIVTEERTVFCNAK